MGMNNSSYYRVVPMMKYMMRKKENLVALLSKMGITVSPDDISDENVFYGKKDNSPSEKGEKALLPSCDYLCKLIEELDKNEYAKKKINEDDDSVTKKKRLELINDDNSRKQAISYIKEKYPAVHGDYRVLEGSSYPDIFIETPQMVIVVESKWTESSPTESTKYQKNRNQMVRHIHSALNYVRLNGRNKQVYGFCIVSKDLEKRYGSELSVDGFRNKLSSQFGIENEIENISNAYKGYTTWETIAKDFPGITDEEEWRIKPINN